MAASRSRATKPAPLPRVSLKPIVSRPALFRAMMSSLPRGLEPVVYNIPIEDHIVVDVPAIRRAVEAAVCADRAQRADRVHASDVRARAWDTIQDALETTFDAAIFISVLGHELRGGLRGELDEAQAYLHAAFGDCLDGAALDAQLSLHVDLMFRIGDQDAPLAGLTFDVAVTQSVEPAAPSTFRTTARAEATEFLTAQYPAVAFADECARDTFVRKILRDVALAVGVPESALVHVDSARITPPYQPPINSTE